MIKYFVSFSCNKGFGNKLFDCETPLRRCDIETITQSIKDKCNVSNVVIICIFKFEGESSVK